MPWIVGKFTSKEFECKCGCGLDKVSPTFLWKLNQGRDETGFPWVIVSGCRCEQHNRDEGGKATSDHLPRPACEGVDILANNAWVRDRIIEVSYKIGIRRRGIGKTFIHLGDRQSNPQNVLWLY